MSSKVIKPKIIAIVGPTASGKSDLAVRLAQKFHGEIISADSRQVYKGLDIGTGKITKREMKGIPHHLLDVASPGGTYSVARYKRAAEHKLRYIVAHKRLPIICGGTGFYIDALLGDVSIPEVPTNKKLRAGLSKKSAAELFKILKKLDSRRAKEIDAKNPVRLIRAIEIAQALGKVPKKNPKDSKYDALKIGIKIEPQTLRHKIAIRLVARMRTGMVKEAQQLHKNGLSWKRMESLGLEYRYLARYLQGKISKDEMLRQLETEIWHYAKRQMTWFKRDKNIYWLPGDLRQTEKLVRNFLKN